METSVEMEEAAARPVAALMGPAAPTAPMSPGIARKNRVFNR